jgi:hypothetical protein
MNTISETIIQLETAALERWNNGDPSGFIELSTSEVTYFDPFLEKRLNGWNALSALYESIRGQVQVDKYELVDPKVQATDHIAVLTFNYIAYSGDLIFRWNCTEVYRMEATGAWKIIHTHWSQMPK